ncbi:Pr6Pr family membrane protein [Streptomyces sp. NPDC018019]|uniref:Pr6Pr family membrane protein n=1 Tax=Streptomyces sp. NPDC018019 TaxID=3365030 RepID=UPI0037A9521C
MIDPTSARVPRSRPPQATSHASSRYARGAAFASAHTPASAVVPPVRRPLAAAFRLLIALAALAGIVLDIAITPDLGRLFSYFTIQSNIAVAVCFAWSAHRAWTARPPISPRITGAVLLYIAITGLVFHFVLSNDSSGFSMTGTPEHDGIRTVSTHLLHTATPIGAALDWLLLTAPRAFRWRYAAQWLAYPFLYLPFALIRGALLDPGTEGRYPYPFLDVDLHGYAGIALNTLVFGSAFYALALVLVGLDQVRPHPRRPENRISPMGIGPLK